MFLEVNKPHNEIPDPRCVKPSDPHSYWTLIDNAYIRGAYYRNTYHATPELHAEYDALFERILHDHQPGSAMEFDICHHLADTLWRGLFLSLAKDEMHAAQSAKTVIKVIKYNLPTHTLNYNQVREETSGCPALWAKMRSNHNTKKHLESLFNLFRHHRLALHRPVRKDLRIFNHVHKRKDRSIMEQAKAIEQAHENTSTGPKTEEGKARSSQNARKSGIWSRYIEISSPQEAYDFGVILQGFQETYNPKGTTEEGLVHDLARARYNRLRMERYDDQQWNQNCAEMIALREKRGDADPTKNIEIDVLKTFDLATYPNIARRLRAAKSDYNQALKQLTQLQRQRRLEAAEKAKQAKESDRQANKGAQETQDRSTRSGPPPHPTGFVPATSETPPEPLL